MAKHLAALFIILFYQTLFATQELLVKPDSVSYAGYSAIATDLSTIYGGIAGNACISPDGNNPCNTCIDSGGGVNACNTTSVYANLKFSVSFKVTKTVTGVAKLFIEGSTPGDYSTAVSILPSATYTQDTSTVVLETTWSEICLRAGLTNCTGFSVLAATKGIKFGVDSDSSGEVEEAERKSASIKLHFIPVGALDATQALCANNSSGMGMCNLTFTAGDQKVFIDTAVYSGADSASGVDWEAIAAFPVPTTLGGEAGVYASFYNGRVSPIFKTFEATGANVGAIPDSQISGGIANYTRYCMVYATKNKAQNIYKFVTTGVDTTKSCVTPSEVLGILNDKRCFISTAAFGSASAPEVEIFRKFRNQFLLTNFLGKQFVKFYYKISPTIANVIADNSYLKTNTRMLLYPLLVFAASALKFGFFITSFALLTLLLALLKFSRRVSKAQITLLIFILALTPSLKAEITSSSLSSSSDTTTVNHPGALEGLVRIKQDGTYIYDTERPFKKESSHLRLGRATHPDISISIEQTDASGNPTGTFVDYNFRDFYKEDSGLIVGYDYEWFPWVDKGKLGLQAGVSALFVSGHGKLRASPNPDSTEVFTFITLPITIGATYRLEWKDKQLLAPYVSGGGTYTLLIEKREDIAKPDFAGAVGYYGAGGILFNLGALDRDAGFQLDSEYGISNMWISLEYKTLIQKKT